MTCSAPRATRLRFEGRLVLQAAWGPEETLSGDGSVAVEREGGETVFRVELPVDDRVEGGR